MRLKIEINVISGAVITGKNSCDWCKPPSWPYNPEHIVEFCGCMATRGFKRAIREASKEAYRQLMATGQVTNEIRVNMGERPEGPPNTEGIETQHPMEVGKPGKPGSPEREIYEEMERHKEKEDG